MDVYLRPETKIEPLSCGWYAWGHLVLPVQQAFNIAFRQLPLLQSFIANPAVHEAASMDPALLGAPFLQLKRACVPKVAALRADTAQVHAPLIRFAEAFMELKSQLEASATGFSLEAFYEKLPAPLSGMTELVYDLSNRCTIRLIEPLANGGELDNSATQSIALFQAKDRSRDFFLNTPRLETPERMILPLPFASDAFDVIATSRIRPVSFETLVGALRVPDSSSERFRQFVTTTPPERNRPEYDGGEVRIRYFGHACVLVQTASTSILVDPLAVFSHEEPEASLAFEDLPDFIDYVFITHNHQDHLCPEMLLQLRARVGHVLVPRNNSENIADPSLLLTLKALGFERITVLDPLDSVSVPEGEIVSLPFLGEHADLSIHAKHGMYLRIKGRVLAFVADSNGLDRNLYARLVRRLGKVDTLFIGMECDGAPLSWLYSPYLSNPVKRKDDESRRLSGSDSVRAWAVIEELGCRRVFVYAMGQEPWLQYLCGLRYTESSKQIVESNKLVERCRAASIEAERLYGCREMVL